MEDQEAAADDDVLSRLLDEYGDPTDDVFRKGLREIVALRAVLTSLESQLVVGARLRRHSWRTLGKDLGLGAGGVRRRHLAVDPPRAREPYREPLLAEVLAQLVAPPPG